MLRHSFILLPQLVLLCLLGLLSSTTRVAAAPRPLRTPRTPRTQLLPVRSVDGPVRPNGYLITYKSDVDAAEVQTQIVDTYGADVVRYKYDCASFSGMAGTFDDDQLESLRASPDIEAIEVDSVGHADTLVAQTDAPWGLQRISQLNPLRYSDITALDYTYTYDDSAGAGVDIYIVDSGISLTHADFGGRAKWGKTFGNYTPDIDGYGHGTHVAGIAGGTRFGVAKKATLIAVRVLDSRGSGFSSDAISAIQWIINQARTTGRPSVINISVRYTVNAMLDAAVTDAINAGIHVVVSAGNNSVDASNQSPARAPAVTTVGATDVNDEMAYYSNYGPLVDIFAPGTAIISDYIGSNTATKLDSGTSMAAPHVAGMTAYLLGRLGKQSPATILAFMKSISTPGVLRLVAPNTQNIFLGNGVYLDPFNDHSTTVTITRARTLNGAEPTTSAIGFTADAVATEAALVANGTFGTVSPADVIAAPTMTA